MYGRIEAFRLPGALAGEKGMTGSGHGELGYRPKGFGFSDEHFGITPKPSTLDGR